MRIVLVALLAAGFALTGYSLATADLAFAEAPVSSAPSVGIEVVYLADGTPVVLDPLEQPAESIGFVEKLWRSGAWTSVGIVVAFFVLVALRNRVAWLAVGSRALIVTAALSGLSFLVDGIANGRTPNASMLIIAICMSLAQAQNPKPPPPAAKATAVGLLVLLLALVGCSAMKDGARAAGAAVLDCTKGELAGAVNDLAPMAEKIVLDALDPAGDVNWRPVREYAVGLATSVGKCVLAEGVARVLAPKPDDPLAPKVGGIVINHTAVRIGFANLKSELFGPVTFQTSAGAL
jgi:hypothetical protein